MYCPSKKFRHEIRRRENVAYRLYKDNLIFEYNTDKDTRFFREALAFHRKKWQKDLYTDVDKFLEELFLNTDMVLLSRLSLSKDDRTVAYDFSYMDSNKVVWLSISSYDLDYRDISPGKVLLYMLINKSFENKFKKFDFGRGAEGYKYLYSNYDEILINISTYNKTSLRLRKFFDKVLSILWRKKNAE